MPECVPDEVRQHLTEARGIPVPLDVAIDDYVDLPTRIGGYEFGHGLAGNAQEVGRSAFDRNAAASRARAKSNSSSMM